MKISPRNIIIFSVLALVIIMSFVTAIDISGFSFVDANNASFTSEQPTIDDVIRCKWTPSGDVTSQEVRWYNGTSLYSGPTVVPPGTTYHDLSAGVVRKGEIWWCNVSLRNASDPFQEYG